jgi:phosphoserine phosphatase
LFLLETGVNTGVFSTQLSNNPLEVNGIYIGLICQSIFALLSLPARVGWRFSPTRWRDEEPMKKTTTVAFVRVEGTLVDRGVLSASAYIASNGQGLSERLFRLGQVALTVPVYSLLGQNDRVLANRLAFVAARGMSEDILKERLLDSGIELLKKAKTAGHQIVLLSEGIDPFIRPLITHLADKLDIDDLTQSLVCNTLELRAGEATGRLLDPVVGGHDSGRWASQYAQEHGVDLERSVAYAAHGPDMLLLAAVGNPCAVNPDYTLRRAASQADWPIMEYTL